MTATFNGGNAHKFAVWREGTEFVRMFDDVSQAKILATAEALSTGLPHEVRQVSDQDQRTLTAQVMARMAGGL